MRAATEADQSRSVLAFPPLLPPSQPAGLLTTQPAGRFGPLLLLPGARLAQESPTDLLVSMLSSSEHHVALAKHDCVMPQFAPSRDATA